MAEEVEVPTVENTDVEKSESPAETRVELTRDERMDVLREIEVVTGVINSTMHIPKFDQNKDVSKRKLTSSVELSILNNDEMQAMKGVLAALLNKL